MSMLSSVAERLRTSLWFIPALFAVGAFIAALVLVALDRQLQTSGPAFYIYGGTPEGARNMLSTIAQSMLTFTGLVFTITMLVLQLASSQLSPRVLRTFLADRANQVVLGLFVATFVYTLVVLRDIRSGEAGEEFVPGLAIWLAFVLLLASVAAFVYYINHMAHAIRASTVIANITRDTRQVVDRVYPERPREPDTGQRQADAASLPTGGEWSTVAAQSAGYVTGIDDDGLVRDASEHDLVIRVLTATGDFVADGVPVLKVNRPAVGDEMAQQLWSRVSVARERTMQQDVAYGFRQLVDIGARALSPGTNDPTTASQVVDALHELLLQLAARPIPSPIRLDEEGVARVVLNEPDWDDYVELALEELRAYGSGHIQVVRRLASLITGVAAQSSVERRQALFQQLDRMRAQLGEADGALRVDLERALADGSRRGATE
jgi:uncharacterized membrane protein